MSDRKITVFCCENSAAKAADSLGPAGIPPGVTLLRVPCSGRVEVGQILKCLEEGDDKVLVLGCPTDNCNYIRGNRRALKRTAAVRRILKDAGLEEQRVRIELVSSVDAHKVRRILEEMTSP